VTLLTAVPLLCVLLSACTTAAPAVPGPTVTQTVTAAPSGPAVGQVAPHDCGPLLQGDDGDFGNAICKDGHPNSAAVDELRHDGYLTIDLDPYATEQQVQAALCVDAATLTKPIRETLYSVAAALNRWHFVDPILDNSGDPTGTCPG